MAHLGSYTEVLQKMGVEVIYAPFYMNVTEYLTQHAGDFDAFYITRYYVAQSVLNQIRAQAPNAKIIFNNADLHFLRELRAAKSEGDLGKLEPARQTRTEEMEVINNVDVVLSYTDIEHSVIQAYTDGQASVLKCPWVVEVPNVIPPQKIASACHSWAATDIIQTPKASRGSSIISCLRCMQGALTSHWRSTGLV
jgi:hypothetical protein